MGNALTSKLSDALNAFEQEAQAEFSPLVAKKTSLLNNMSEQQKFMDEQFQKNADLMEKNIDLELRISEIEKLLQAREEEKQEPTEDELPP